MKDRVEALKWWNEFSSLGKTRICDLNTEILGGIRRYESLTGFEIEKLWVLNKNNISY